MKVLIVSGLLGAGKTTFIQTMAQKSGQDFVVMENEYGEAGIDSARLGQDKNLNVWEMTEGCVCCTMKADFASSILTIANTLDPEYLIVEPTGVGFLSNIIQNIRQISYERITLLAPVTILDADSFDLSRAVYKDILRDQLQFAGTIVISKRHPASSGEEAELINDIRRIAPNAVIQYDHYSHQPLSWWNALLRKGLGGSPLPSSALEEPDWETLSLRDLFLPSPNHLIFFLEDLIRGAYGCILRAKGTIQAGDFLYRFDVVNNRYAICGCEPEEASMATFIGIQLRRNPLRKALLSRLYRMPKIRMIR